MASLRCAETDLLGLLVLEWVLLTWLMWYGMIQYNTLGVRCDASLLMYCGGLHSAQYGMV